MSRQTFSKMRIYYPEGLYRKFVRMSWDELKAVHTHWYRAYEKYTALMMSGEDDTTYTTTKVMPPKSEWARMFELMMKCSPMLRHGVDGRRDGCGLLIEMAEDALVEKFVRERPRKQIKTQIKNSKR